MRTVLVYNLQQAGYLVASAVNGEDALISIKEKKPDLIIADWMVPKISGLELCRILRRSAEFYLLPIVLLTARGEHNDKLLGLETGADDYITKPFSIGELLARLKALLRRSMGLNPVNHILYGDLRVDINQYRAYNQDKLIFLSPTEFKILRHLLCNQGRVIKREQLLDAVWGDDGDVDLRTVDVHIGRLRQALSNITNPKGADIVRTVRSVGYVIDKIKS